MSRHRLYYKHLDLQGEIPCFKFATPFELKEFIHEIYLLNVINQFNPIYLLCLKDTQTLTGNRNEIFITERHNIIRSLFDGPTNSLIDIVEHVYDPEDYVRDYYLEEYYSYLEAYQQALEMQATNPRCY